MSDDNYSGDLHAWIEPEIEARVVALILGEASDFEAEELERMMEERPEIRVFKRRMESVHGLLGNTLAPGDDAEWRLAPETRANLFEAIELSEPADEVVVMESTDDGGARERRVRKAGRRVMWSAAACFAVTLFVIAMLFRPKGGELAERVMLDGDSDGGKLTSKNVSLRGNSDMLWGDPNAGAHEEPNSEMRELKYYAPPAEAENPVRRALAKLSATLSENEEAKLMEVADPLAAAGPATTPAEITGAFGGNGDEELRTLGRPAGSEKGRAEKGKALAEQAESPAPGRPSQAGVVTGGVGAGGGEPKSNSKIPVLADIPVVGELFQRVDTAEESAPEPAAPPLSRLGAAPAKPAPTATPAPAPFQSAIVVDGAETPTRRVGEKDGKKKGAKVQSVEASKREDHGTFSRMTRGRSEAEKTARAAVDLNGLVAEEERLAQSRAVDKVAGNRSRGEAVAEGESDARVARDESRANGIPQPDGVWRTLSDDSSLETARKITRGDRLASRSKGDRDGDGLGVGREYFGDVSTFKSKKLGGPVGGGGQAQDDGRRWVHDYAREKADGETTLDAKVSGLLGIKGASRDLGQFKGQINHLAMDKDSTVRPLDLLSEFDDEVLAGKGQGQGKGQGLAEGQKGWDQSALWSGFRELGTDNEGGEAIEGPEKNGQAEGFFYQLASGFSKLRSKDHGTNQATPKLVPPEGAAVAEPSLYFDVAGRVDLKAARENFKMGEQDEGNNGYLVLEESERLAIPARNPAAPMALKNEEKLKKQDRKELRDSMADYDLAEEPADAPAGERSVAPTREKLGFGYLGASFGRPGDEDEKRAKPGRDAGRGGNALGKEGDDVTGINGLELAAGASHRFIYPSEYEPPEIGRSASEIRAKLQSKPGQDSIGNSLPGSALAANASGGKPKAADNGKFVPFASGDGQAEAQVRIDRELKITTVNPTEVSNQVTDEVRYTVDQEKNAWGNSVRPVDDYAVKVRDGRTVELLKNLEDQLRSSEEAARMANGRATEYSLARESTEHKLRNVVIPRVDFDDVTVAEAVDFLREQSSSLDAIELDPAKKSVKFEINGGALNDAEARAGEKAPAQDPGEVRLRGLKLENVPLGKALQAIAEQAQLKYRVDADGSVQLSARGFGEDAGIEVREWDIPLYAWKKIQNGQAEMDGKLNASDLLAFKEEGDFVTEPKQALMAYGVTFPEGTLANYATSSGTFVAKNTPENLELIDTLVRGSLEQASREREALKQFEKNAGDEPYSTFSLNVSDVSFKLAKASLNQGEWPPAEQIRVEEFVNAFDYGDPAPNQEEKVACNLEQAAHPFLQQRNLLRVSMRTAALGRAANTPLRLTVLLDNSGSMDRADRVDSVKNAFHLLAGQLNAQDQVTLIGFARSPRLLADRVAGNKVAELANLVEATPSEGGTNIEQALELGIAKAKEQMLEGGQNRIILLTDGAANLGNADPRDLAKLVENMRQQGISFDACGVGAEGLNDRILESLTRKGDGRYYFLDRPEDADAGFAKQIAGALRPAARNVKVQMNFNPNRVGRYRLYGFEKHLLKKEDFRNDSVDAAELAAEEAGNAIYQLELLPEGSGEIGTASVRFQDTESGRMIERIWTIPYEAQVPRLEDSAASMRLASGAALLGEKLKGSLIGEAVEMERLGKLINNLAGDFPSDDRVKELIQMANQVRELSN